MIVGASIGAGQAIGSALAGTSGLGWRLPFAIVGVPSVVLATVMWLTTKDPRRGGSEEALQGAFADGKFEYSEKLSWKKAFYLARIPTNWLMILQVRSSVMGNIVVVPLCYPHKITPKEYELFHLTKIKMPITGGNHSCDHDYSLLVTILHLCSLGFDSSDTVVVCTIH